MGERQNRSLVLISRPEGLVGEENFEMRTGPAPEPADGQVLIRVTWLSFDPTQRGWLLPGGSYKAPLEVGEVMQAYAVGQVVESKHPDYQPGTLVNGMLSWQDWHLSDGSDLTVVPPGVPPQAMLGVYGTTGLTAYFGLTDVGQPREGDVVVVSGAAGATGSVVGQIARILGCRTIGVAGGEAKCAWLVEQAGFDAAIDYKNERVGSRLDELAPGGVDVFFDNVGGEVLNSVLKRIRRGARIVLCGSISTGYVPKQLPPGPSNYFNLCLRSSRMQGFLLGDYRDRFDEGRKQLRQWVEAGKIVYEEDIQEGLENAPRTLRRLFEGANLGKQLLRVADAPLPVPAG
ncbi:MAG TPA: NADP-dependent oxidoreductase [Acidimicrobiales bacterium]|nr:NADP-dependent oxidoreductase [Acidimicrobiales bacterium]